MNNKLPIALTVAVMSLSVLFLATPKALAQNSVSLDKANARAQARMLIRDQKLAPPSAKLLQACQSREDAVIARMNSLVKLSNNMFEVFTRHADRIQEYYLNTAVPAGLTLPNYDDLLADIAAQKAIVQTTLANAQADVDDFSCTSGDIVAHFTAFRTDMQAVKSALKVYRTSIKNLLVAVRTLSSSLEATPTPTPAGTPTP